MVMRMEDVVPWGRSLDEYSKMFSLTAGDLTKTIVSVADGPASFNSEMCALGHRVISEDPLYTLAGHEIAKWFDSIVDDIITQMRAHA